MKSFLGAKKSVLVRGSNIGPMPIHSVCSNNRADQEASKLSFKQEEAFLSAKSMWTSSKLRARIDRLSIFHLATAMPPCWVLPWECFSAAPCTAPTLINSSVAHSAINDFPNFLSKMSSRQMHNSMGLTVDVPKSRLSFHFE